MVVNKIKDLELEEALKVLSLWKKKAAKPIRKLLLSAIANARENYQLDEGDLRIKEIQVNTGPTAKRLKPRARGRGDIVRRRTSHIRLVLEKKE